MPLISVSLEAFSARGTVAQLRARIVELEKENEGLGCTVHFL